jgi:hypothetical protein
LLDGNKGLLYNIQARGNIAQKKLPAVSCICNGDMDVKNVLWVGDNPRVIDLESLNYDNPYVNLFDLALSWSGCSNFKMDYGLLKAFVGAYMQEYGSIRVDWEVLYDSNLGMVEWLEYNVKRALMIECSDEEERQLGISRAVYTLDYLIYCDSIKDRILLELGTIGSG